jgi:imidazolonepropionase-like amidohydrolase
MQRIRLGCLILGMASAALGQSIPAPPTHFINGLWFNGSSFAKNDWYAVQGILTHRPVKDAVTVDLHGSYVVPPYGDAHEHMFDGTRGLKELTETYLRDGIFYAQGMTDTTDGTAAIVKSGLVNTPSTVDVTYAHGALTAPNGHPKEIYESMLNGFYYPVTPEQKAVVIRGQQGEGHSYWQIGTLADLEAKWPKILAAKPQLIKIILTDSEEYKRSTAEDPQLAKGLDPALVAPIVERAHAAGLKVAVHVDTRTDVHNAIAGGVDELGHMPGYAISASDDVSQYRIADADIAVMAKRGVRVQATAGIVTGDETPTADKKVRHDSQVDNLKRLKAAGVIVLVGSDRYGSDSLHEADYLQSLGVYSNLEMLRMWSVDTPRDIFPKREIGELDGGFEASFLVLAADPLQDWTATHNIIDRWKQGQHVVLEAK